MRSAPVDAWLLIDGMIALVLAVMIWAPGRRARHRLSARVWVSMFFRGISRLVPALVGHRRFA